MVGLRCVDTNAGDGEEIRGSQPSRERELCPQLGRRRGNQGVLTLSGEEARPPDGEGDEFVKVRARDRMVSSMRGTFLWAHSSVG